MPDPSSKAAWWPRECGLARWVAGFMLAASTVCGVALADDAPGAESTRRMVELLETLARSADPYSSYTVGSEERLTHYERRYRETQNPRFQYQAAYELLLDGRTSEALDRFLSMRRIFQRIAPTDPVIQRLNAAVALSYLRLGEEENCLARHGPDSCLLPIRGSGIHVNPRGSQMAIEELRKMLEADPADAASMWLLNLAYMTLGQYPDAVPQAWRIPPSVFASDHAMTPFLNVAGRLGLDVLGLAGGAIMDDFDGDGLLDIMASGWGLREQIRYFRNNGDGTFDERTRQAGLLGEVSGLNLTHADYDNDGDVDVFVPRGAWLATNGRHPNSLLRNNGDGTFVDVTVQAGLLSFRPTQTAVWGDYDNDGWLDLFIGNESADGYTHPCELYRNNGDGTFREIATEVGLDHIGSVKGAAWGDYDNDGRLDLYLSRMTQPNVLFHNDGPQDDRWRFSDVTSQAGVVEPLSSFPVWFFDYDNDGWLDLFVASFPGFWGDNLESIVLDYLGRPSPAERPRLYRNDGDGTFTDVTREVGPADAMLVMGANFGDLDNDGFLDIYLGTGEPHLRTLVPNRMYRNDGGRRFQDVTESGRFGHLQKGHGIAFGDLDNDGDQDIYVVQGGAVRGDVAHNVLFLNPGSTNRWITLRLEGTRSNRSGVGARIRVKVDTKQGPREIHVTAGTGGSFGSSSLQQEIGLGQATAIREVEIRWPGTAETQRIPALELDRVYRIVEGQAQAKPLRVERVPLGGDSPAPAPAVLQRDGSP